MVDERPGSFRARAPAAGRRRRAPPGARPPGAGGGAGTDGHQRLRPHGEHDVQRHARRVVRGAGGRVRAHRPADRELHRVRAGRRDAPRARGRARRALRGGDGVARGYVGRPAATAERFVPDPFRRSPGARMYRTGDRVRWTADGTLEFLGRVDTQVKLRGFRVEPGEVEAALLRLSGVARPSWWSARTAGEKRLVAYVVGAEDGVVSPAGLRAALAETLPEYLVPVGVRPAGRAAAHAQWQGGPARPPGAGLRGRRRGGVRGAPHARGGDARRHLARRAGRRPRGPRRQLLRAGRPLAPGHPDDVPRPRGAGGGGAAAGAVRGAHGRRSWRSGWSTSSARTPESQAPPVVPVSRDGALPLSFAQQRLWFIEQLRPGQSTYNVPAALRLRGALDAGALERALTALVARHEALRTTFGTGRASPCRWWRTRRRSSSPWTICAPCRRRSGRRRFGGRRRTRRRGRSTWRRMPPFRARLLRLDAEERAGVLHHAPHRQRRLVAWACWCARCRRCTRRSRRDVIRSSPSCPCSTRTSRPGSARWLAGDVLEAQLAWWRERLAGASPAAGAAHGPPAPAGAGLARARGARFRLPAATAAALQALWRGAREPRSS